MNSENRCSAPLFTAAKCVSCTHSHRHNLWLVFMRKRVICCSLCFHRDCHTAPLATASDAHDYEYIDKSFTICNYSICALFRTHLIPFLFVWSLQNGKIERCTEATIWSNSSAQQLRQTHVQFDENSEDNRPDRTQRIQIIYTQFHISDKSILIDAMEMSASSIWSISYWMISN